MVLGTTFLTFLWTLIVIFFMVIFFILLFQALIDLFRRHDASGGKKVLWIIFLIVLPFLGVFTYYIVIGKGMAERQVKEAKQSQQQFDSYVQTVAGGSADQIAKGQELLKSGAITQEEFDQLKAKALAS
jgi:predicted PurR-regulated permease PerM